MLSSATSILVSLPACAAGYLRAAEADTAAGYFAGADPPGGWLGSAGGSVNLLHQAWLAQSPGVPFADWLEESRKLLVHGGGQGRRLPAYAAVGKPLIPFPVLRWAHGQSLDQTLLDVEVPAYDRLLAAAPPAYRVAVASGDIVLELPRELPEVPEADVLVVTTTVSPEVARNHGVIVAAHAEPTQVEFMLQKPTEARIRELSADYLVTVDSGMWLLSRRAVEVLLARSGWDAGRQEFRNGGPAAYELYSDFGLALGRRPSRPDAGIQGLSCAVLCIANCEFLHFGTSRQLIERVWDMQNRTPSGVQAVRRPTHPDQITQNSSFRAAIRRDTHHTLWVENSTIPEGWKLSSGHVLTGIPDNEWELGLEPGACLDVTPVDDALHALRLYGIDDTFRGPIGEADTLWFGRAASRWFIDRGIDLAATGIRPETDIQSAPLFPVLDWSCVRPGFVAWMFAEHPESSEEHRSLWMSARRVSAAELGALVNMGRLEAQRRANRLASLATMHTNRAFSVFYQLDLESAADAFAGSGAELPTDRDLRGLGTIHEAMWRSEVHRRRGQDGTADDAAAFEALRTAIIGTIADSRVRPRFDVLADQMVWGRSPLRVDISGTWTDTPPYCIVHGGGVTNMAVEINGQPPVHAFAKRSAQPCITIRSIDLGAAEVIRTYEELGAYARPGSEYALARAALAQAGFMPAFHADGGYATLEEQLRDLGGGIEISLLAVAPQGSGLGTSSILAGTVLSALSNLLELGWGTDEIMLRTLALEQMITTGGGWQDQAGGLLRGVKYNQTVPGPRQQITTRWLPEHLFTEGCSRGTVLLYFTGITRMAKRILEQIVRGMFLNRAESLSVLRDIGLNGAVAADAIQRGDWDGLCRSVSWTWDLNKRLHEGINTPEVQAMLDSIHDLAGGYRLLGAGGGGYMLILAKDEEAGARIKRILTENRPNGGARFVSPSVSATGCEVTRS